VTLERRPAIQRFGARLSPAAAAVGAIFLAGQDDRHRGGGGGGGAAEGEGSDGGGDGPISIIFFLWPGGSARLNRTLRKDRTGQDKNRGGGGGGGGCSLSPSKRGGHKVTVSSRASTDVTTLYETLEMTIVVDCNSFVVAQHQWLSPFPRLPRGRHYAEQHSFIRAYMYR
jgi:hypothetical protein